MPAPPPRTSPTWPPLSGPGPRPSGGETGKEPPLTSADPQERRGFLRWLRSTHIRRALLLVLVCLVSALLQIEQVRIPTAQYRAGDVATRDVRSPVSFTYEDHQLSAARAKKAETDVAPVFDFDATLVTRIQNRISMAFDAARRKMGEVGGRKDPQDDAARAVSAEFVGALEIALDDAWVRDLFTRGFPAEVEDLANEFVGVGMRRYIIADRVLLPSPVRPISVIRLLSETQQEITLEDYQPILTPEEARQEIALNLLELERGRTDPAVLKLAAGIARAAIRPNFSYNQLLTTERQRAARERVELVMHEVKRGTTLFRAGDVIEQRHVDMLDALSSSRLRSGLVGMLLSFVALTTLVVATVYLFAAGHVQRFARETRNLEAMGFILLLCLALARAAIVASNAIFADGGGGLDPSSFWLLVPVAGGAMLTRILVNGETALVFAVVVSVLTGFMMDQQAWFTVFFLLSSVAAAGAIQQTHERLHVVRAGAQGALVNGTVVLVLDIVRLHLTPSAGVNLVSVLWDIFFAVLGGGLSAIMVLGLVPFFEVFGFVTDYKLLELSNLNHPLLRQLMLRAPGTYHHSVIVGSLAEGAAEAIGANPLLARVGAYFHDVGKAVKPHYYVENQRDVPNPHGRLSPHQSAAVLINHVRDGAALAREHRLPRQVIDAILMHHGTGIVLYFYDKACKSAEPGETVDPADFRYPGPRPNTREAGILHLADKVEAASRTLERPSPEGIREVIQNITNSVMNDGQLEECPLTLKELITIARTFEKVLLGIYHARIEYPEGRTVPPQEPGRSSVITLDFQNPLREGAASNGRAPDPGEGTSPPQGEVLDPAHDIPRE